MTEVACCICLVEYPSWKVNNPRYCCSALICQECAKSLHKCPQCRHQSPTEIVDSDSEIGSDSEGNSVEVLIDTPTFKCSLITEEGEDDVEHHRYLEICHFKDGKLHHNSAPAQVTYRNNGMKTSEEWYKNGKLHRDGKAALIRYNFTNSKVNHKQWYRNGLSYRDGDRPTLIRYYENGNIYMERWHDDCGRLHREGDMPAEIQYFENTVIRVMSYYKNGKRHRVGGPAYIDYWDNGTAMMEMFYNNDELCYNGEGYSMVHYDRDGTRCKPSHFPFDDDRRIIPGTAYVTIPASSGFIDLERSHVVVTREFPSPGVP